jgi:hypothetical protein
MTLSGFVIVFALMVEVYIAEVVQPSGGVACWETATLIPPDVVPHPRSCAFLSEPAPYCQSCGVCPFLARLEWLNDGKRAATLIM